jgi:hypothetical protein
MTAREKMKFATIVGVPLTVAGLVLSFPPLQEVLTKAFGETGYLSGSVVFASGWALIAGFLAFNLGKQSQEDIS